MSEKDCSPASRSRSKPKRSAEESRKARLDAALRANLRRRKDQVRNRGVDQDSGNRDTPSIFKTEDGRAGSE